ncbi:MAG: GNAT family N-acetyltransferase [Truepera sp.]|nr:GNAT family N-acetyltransferase [Truepera sp.]
MTTRARLPLTTARLQLRPLQPTDQEAFLSYRNDPEVIRYQSWTQLTPEEAQAFLQQAAAATPGPGQSLQLAITLQGSNLLIGDCLLQLSADGQQGEISFTLSPLYQGQGYGLEAVTALLEYAFGTLNLHRISAVTDARHTASAKLLMRLGMRREGHLLQSRQVRGVWQDELLYGLLASEWPTKRAS